MGQRWNDCFWCFEVLDSLLGYDDEFKFRYATGESYLNWEKAGLDPEKGQKQTGCCPNGNPFERSLKGFCQQILVKRKISDVNCVRPKGEF